MAGQDTGSAAEAPLTALERARDAAARVVDGELERLLAIGKGPDRLVMAMRHAIFAGGKRMRPFLVLESAKLLGVEGAGPLAVAAAIEAVHCYSLVHDDLPAMDNDDLRRGQPTVHRAYDEATAILAGDALLTLAFAAILRPGTGIPAGKRVRLAAMLAEAAGIDGMVGGQMLDLAAEGRFGRKGRFSGVAIRRLQALKTGALIEFSCLAGAILARKADAAERRALRTYGRALGLAFQIRDDLLDVEGEAGKVGKALAKDAGAGKATFVGLLGITGAKEELARVTGAGRAALSGVFGHRAALLDALLEFNRIRDH